MLVFISDLHLMDQGFKEAIPTSRLVHVVGSILRRALDHGVNEQDMRLVLLGDIFEIIKSQQWIDNGIRPWEATTANHQRVVAAIYDSILKANPAFEKWLHGLHETYPQLRIDYIPGNHDLAINTEMGDLVRPKLRKLLSQPPTADRFGDEIYDVGHSVLARHGHEWDSNNRSGGRGAPFGDVIVIEVLTRLPLRMAEILGKNLQNGELDFLFELDNVRPQTRGGLACWLDSGLQKLCAHRRDAAEVFDEVFTEILDTLWALGRTNKFEAFRYSSRASTIATRIVMKAAEARGVHKLIRLFPLKEESPGHYPQHARQFLAAGSNAPVKYFVCGHTHVPEHVPLSYGRSSNGHCLYMNTGTWRRVHVPRNLDRPSSEPAFASHQAECVVTVFDVAEQQRGLPPYEYYRTVHGLG